MNRRPSFVRGLLLLIVALGPLQAQAVFACAMMETVVHDECCCGDHQAAEGCTDHDCDSNLDSATSCCEGSVELGLDQEAAGEAAAFKPPESDSDPPPALLFPADTLLLPESSPVPGAFSRTTPPHEPGTDTWLITQRLRI